MAGGGLRVDVSRDEGDEHAEGTAQPKARFSGGSPSGESSLVQQRFPSSKMKVDELFIQWLSLPESQKLVMSLLEDAKAGRPLIAPGGPNSHSASGSLSPLSPTSASSLFGATPPLSPRSDKPMSPKSPLRRQASGLSHAGSPVKPHANRSFEAIPQFYFPNGPPATEDVAKQCMVKIHQFFHEHPEGLNAEAFMAVTQEVCNVPSYPNTPVASGPNPLSLHLPSHSPHVSPPPPRSIHGGDTGDAFMRFWVDRRLLAADMATQIFHVLKQDHQNYLVQVLSEAVVQVPEAVVQVLSEAVVQVPSAAVVQVLPEAVVQVLSAAVVQVLSASVVQDDFKPIMRELLNRHPGLEFLHDTPEFQERYAETVIYRIFYHISRSGNGRISLRELKKSNLMQALQQVEEEEDINKVLKYFSYEHFYVVYCKFWELDSDHDFLIDKDDLLRYGNHALTYRIVERIFAQVPRPFTSGVEGKMGYEDFVWFILSEEDKSSEPSLEYWFRCVDLDGDERITAPEMQYFYEEQLHRMECMAQEPVLFEDVVCQMADMIKPAVSMGGREMLAQ
ncbi:unnamed protein product [Closterium sp. NIES-65]|nr:unnamed protein product [Closterium sp. NIES-65]